MVSVTASRSKGRGFKTRTSLGREWSRKYNAGGLNLRPKFSVSLGHLRHSNFYVLNTKWASLTRLGITAASLAFGRWSDQCNNNGQLFNKHSKASLTISKHTEKKFNPWTWNTFTDEVMFTHEQDCRPEPRAWTYQDNFHRFYTTLFVSTLIGL